MSFEFYYLADFEFRLGGKAVYTTQFGHCSTVAGRNFAERVAFAHLANTAARVFRSRRCRLWSGRIFAAVFLGILRIGIVREITCFLIGILVI